MYHFTIPMALLDFIPVAFFGVAAFVLQRDLYNKMSRNVFSMFSSGTVNIFAAGFLKALWKLLYAANICDFQALYTMFLPVQSLGFALAGISIVMMLLKKKTVMASAAPPVFASSIPFLVMMTLGLGAICTALSIIAVKMKKRSAAVLFVLSFLASMGMGALAGFDMTLAWVNWAEQGINCVGQGLLMWGVIVLDRAGLKEYK